MLVGIPLEERIARAACVGVPPVTVRDSKKTSAYAQSPGHVACVPGHHYNHYCKRICIPASEWQLHESFCGKHHNLPDFNVVQPHTHGTKTLSGIPCISHMLPGSH